MNAGASTRDLERRLSENPASPLFARLAETLLKHGESGRASTLCERGLELYPDYTTGRLVHARCLAARGRYDDALASLSTVIERYPGNLVLADLAEEWRARSGAGPGAGDDFAVFTEAPAEPVGGAGGDSIAEAEPVEVQAVEVQAVEAEPVEAEPAPAVAPVAEMPAPAGPPADTAAIDAPAADPDPAEVQLPGEGVPPSPLPGPRIGEVPILQPVPERGMPTAFIEPDRIVSRTLAEIYASQGAIGEAVETYRILLERLPQRSETMEERLRELEERMRNDPGPARAREE